MDPTFYAKKLKEKKMVFIIIINYRLKLKLK